MRKKLLAGFVAIPMALATLVGLTGCDLMDAITGGSDDDDDSVQTGGSGGIKGNQVTENQWEEVFGNADNYKNYTTDLTGVVTMSMGGMTQKQTAKGKFLVDGSKNYTKTEVEGMGETYVMEMYGYQASGRDYTWVRHDDSQTWEQETVNGIALSNIMMADYAGCYGCFKYNSSSKRYEATKDGLEELLGIFMNSGTGDMTDFPSTELQKCSFAISNGVPTSASMTIYMSISMGEGMTQTVTQEINYTFSDYGKTTVTYPTQIQNELKELGIGGSGSDDKDPEKPGTTTPSNPDDTTGDKVNEANWVKIFKELEENSNCTVDMTGMITSSMMGSSYDSEMSAKFLMDGNKSYSETNSGNSALKVYQYNYNNNVYAWVNESGSNWEYVTDMSLGGTDTIFAMDYTKFYGYVKYDAKTQAYITTQEGLDYLWDTIGDAILGAMQGSGMSVKGEISEFAFKIKNNALYSIDMEMSFTMSGYGQSISVEEDLQYVYSKVGSTKVTFPTQVQNDIKIIEAGGIPGSGNPDVENPKPDNPETPSVPNRPNVTTDEVSTSVWRKAFNCISNGNYTVELDMGAGSNAFIQIDGDKKLIAMYDDGELYGNLWQLHTSTNDYAWVNSDNNTWERYDEANMDNLLVFLDGDFASLYSASKRTLNSDTGCYEITSSGLAELSKAVNASDKLPAANATVTITSCSIVIKDGVVYSIVMDTQIKMGNSISYGTASYYFSDIGNTYVEVPTQIRNELKDLGISA